MGKIVLSALASLIEAPQSWQETEGKHVRKWSQTVGGVVGEGRKRKRKCFQAWWSFMWSLAHQRDLKEKVWQSRHGPQVSFFFKYLKRQDSPSLCVIYVSYFPSDGSPAFPLLEINAQASNYILKYWYPMAITQYNASSQFALTISACS